MNKNDVQILRELARRVYDISQEPVMEERWRLWLKHDAFQGERPMILAETGGVLDELIPVSMLRCTEDSARWIERGLLNTIFVYEMVQDDTVVEPYIDCNWHISTGDYGVQEITHRPDTGGTLGAIRWDPPLRNVREDLEKLRFRQFSVDREATLRRKQQLEEIFDGILTVRIHGSFWWTMGLTIVAIRLIGLDNLMLYMYDDPEGMHKLMSFLRDDHLNMIQWCEREGLLSLNNRNDYIGSGSHGYTNALPQADYREGGPVRLKDLWCLSESQETVGVSPAMFAEFILPYQMPIIEKFGFCYYGCCEPIHTRWESIATIPNLRRLSISPWCDQKIMAEVCRDKYTFCRKPNPEQVSRPKFDEEAARADIRNTLDTARGCHVELVMKDVHTVSKDRERLGRWVAIAREEIAKG